MLKYLSTFQDYEHCLQCYLETRLDWNYLCFSKFDFRQGSKGETFCFDSLETASVFLEVLLVDGVAADEAVDHLQPLGDFDEALVRSRPQLSWKLQLGSIADRLAPKL